MAHIQRCSKDIGYLAQRRYSALDAKSKFAQYHVSSDSLWIYIPLVRYLCDSVSTVDSLKCQPVRTYALSFFKGSDQLQGFWFVEDTPTPLYHRNHIMSIWYNNLTGRQQYFNESGRLISSKRLYQGLKSSLTRFADADSSDNWEIEIPEYEVTAPHPNRGGYWGKPYSPWGDIPIIDTNIEGNIGDIGADAGGSSNTDKPKEKKPNSPVQDCKDSIMQKAKAAVQKTYGNLLKATNFSIGTQNLYAKDEFSKKVSSNRGIEWSTVLRNFTYANRGIGISEVRTDNQAFRCGVELLSEDHAAEAIMHNHPNSSCLSPQDIMTLLGNIDGHPNLNTIMAWDDLNDTYYCATIVDKKKATEFYEKFKDGVNKETGDWSSQDILNFLNTEKKSFSKYKGEDKNLFRLAAILQYFDTGVCLTKITNEKDAGGDIETHYTSYGAYKNANAKYINTKICQE